ncbi:poly-gamma-glutamate synthase PgsB [bacterium]|nr:poly-gamma-glutamate synthase PgsB [bacterium]
MQLVIFIGLVLLAAGVAESALHGRNLRAVPIRVLVNGTRGKSSVTRLVAGALREAGIATIAKTTGSAARVIFEDGTEAPVKRPFGARLTEQKALARLAAARKARALVVEGMAVRPESQRAMRDHFVRPTMTVITNARVDHIEEMGPYLADTVAALSLSVPPGGTLVTADRRFSGLAAKTLIVDPGTVGQKELARFGYPAFAENVALALAAAAELGVDAATALRGMEKAAPDIGVLRVFRLRLDHAAAGRGHGAAYFVAGFAANDLESTEMVWREALPLLPEGLPLALLYNNRADREYRVPEFVRLPGRIGGVSLVAAAGEHRAKVARKFAEASGAATMELGKSADPADALRGIAERMPAPGRGGESEGREEAFVVFGVGNIHGFGLAMTEYCVEHGEPCGWKGEAQCCRKP